MTLSSVSRNAGPFVKTVHEDTLHIVFLISLSTSILTHTSGSFPLLTVGVNQDIGAIESRQQNQNIERITNSRLKRNARLLICLAVAVLVLFLAHQMFLTRKARAHASVRKVADAVRSFQEREGRWPLSLEELGDPTLTEFEGVRFEYDPTNVMVRLPIWFEKPSLLEALIGLKGGDGNYGIGLLPPAHYSVLDTGSSNRPLPNMTEMMGMTRVECESKYHLNQYKTWDRWVWLKDGEIRILYFAERGDLMLNYSESGTVTSVSWHPSDLSQEERVRKMTDSWNGRDMKRE